MRVLHTSDWHFGRALEGRSRQEEFEQFVDELCGIVTQEAIDLIIVAGDIFDTVNPPAAAEALYYDGLARLADGGKRAVVVIAGNHDSPDRLCAVRQLAQRHGITLLGYPYDDPGIHEPAVGVRRISSGPGWAELAIPGVDHSAVVLGLPYPSESRLKLALSASLEDAELQPRYSEMVGQWFATLAGKYRPDTVRLAASHIYVAGGKESEESERPIQMGGAYTVEPSAFPASAQYVALGHLHRAQWVHAAPVKTRYAGAPLSFSFSEAGQVKSVTVLDVKPGDAAPEIREIPLSCGRPLVKWNATEGIAQVEQWVNEGRDARGWIDLTVHLREALSMAEIQRLRRMHEGFVQIHPVYEAADTEVAATREKQSLSLEEQFVRFFRGRSGGAEPNPELVRLFLELATTDDETEVEA